MSSFENRIDQLALLYLEKNYDIQSLSPKEFLEKFNEISKELVHAYQSTRQS